MSRKEEIAEFKKNLGWWRESQSNCWECKRLAHENVERMGNFHKMCTWHLNWMNRISGFWPMED